jgi:hypothetical protein
MKEIRGDSPDRANERLYNSYRVSIEQKQKLVHEESMREEKELERECTFRPQLVTKGKSPYDYVQPKFNKNSANDPIAKASKPAIEQMTKDCTFTPKVSLFAFS